MPNYGEVEWGSKSINWEKHNKIICEDIWTDQTTFRTEIPKPKEKTSVSKKEKEEITHNKI